MTFNREKFESEKQQHVVNQNKDTELKKVALEFLTKADKHNYEYQWTWMGMPIIQMPEDIILAQQVIYETKPDFIIEAGIAWGGSVVYYASLLELMGHGEIIAIDTVLPQSNIDKIMAYAFSHRIHLLEGSSTDANVFCKVKSFLKPDSKVMVILDSNHTHEHVYNELNLYSHLVKQGQYIIAQDTLVEFVPPQLHRVRPWGHGNNPWTAVQQFLSENSDFTNNNKYNQLSLLTCHKDGWICRR
mgnify:CR=1 FL=1